MAETKLYFIWNFIEKGGVFPPFKSFLESWTQTTSYVQKNKQFLSTQLHRNLNPKGKSSPHHLKTPRKATEIISFQKLRFQFTSGVGLLLGSTMDNGHDFAIFFQTICSIAKSQTQIHSRNPEKGNKNQQ